MKLFVCHGMKGIHTRDGVPVRNGIDTLLEKKDLKGARGWRC
jgi:hypothetical protein